MPDPPAPNPAPSPASTGLTLHEHSRLLASPARAWAFLLLIFLAVHAAALFSPSLLDDADATHANAAQHMARTGDWVTLRVNGMRYLEKPPLPYWLAAVDYHLFGYNVFATHLPMALAVLACAILGWVWARRAYGDRAAFYTAIAILTTVGVFLFTRLFIPEVLFTFLLALALYAFLTALEDRKPNRFYLCYAALAVALLAKGLIAPVFFLAAIVPYLLVVGEWRRWREFHLVTGLLLFLAIAAPWHVMAALRNPDHGHPQGNIPTFGHVHGFLYFYFVNEHVLRFLGKRYPHDYNKQPWWVFWIGHLAWLFPWCLFFPAALQRAWHNRRALWNDLRYDASNTLHFLDPRTSAHHAAALARHTRFRVRSGLLLSLYAAFILIFFSLSTNQEYYTFPCYFALLLLTAGALASLEQEHEHANPAPAATHPLPLRNKYLAAAHQLFACIGLGAAAALLYGLWASRKLPFVADIGTLLAHRAVGDYSLSMSHFFDLTGPSFAALRLPAAIAALALLAGPVLALALRRRGHGFESTLSVALTAAVFLVAAHIALIRFEPLLSSRAMADTINRIDGTVDSGNDQLLVYGDQANASSVIFYTHRQALLVNGRSSSMLWGSCYPDIPHIFIEDPELVSSWGHGVRHFLVVPPESDAHVQTLLRGKLLRLQVVSDRTLYTDRPV